ncbi:34397_t:CDS:1, partial [Gigaspora margarita]
REHQDEHYCLASVKGAKQFAKTFASASIIISQDDKSKIGLGVPAISRTFRTLQSFAEPVRVSDHNFPCGHDQKLVPSVYLMIQPDKTNDDIRSEQLAIFVRLQWLLGTLSETHMEDLSSLISNAQYTEALK